MRKSIKNRYSKKKKNILKTHKKKKQNRKKTLKLKREKRPFKSSKNLNKQLRTKKMRGGAASMVSSLAQSFINICYDKYCRLTGKPIKEEIDIEADSDYELIRKLNSNVNWYTHQILGTLKKYRKTNRKDLRYLKMKNTLSYSSLKTHLNKLKIFMSVNKNKTPLEELRDRIISLINTNSKENEDEIIKATKQFIRYSEEIDLHIFMISSHIDEEIIKMTKKEKHNENQSPEICSWTQDEQSSAGWERIYSTEWNRYYWIYHKLVDEEGRLPIMFQSPCPGDEYAPDGYSDRKLTNPNIYKNIAFRNNIIYELGGLCDSKTYNCGNIGLVVKHENAEKGYYYIGDSMIDDTVTPETTRDILHKAIGFTSSRR